MEKMSHANKGRFDSLIGHPVDVPPYVSLDGMVFRLTSIPQFRSGIGRGETQNRGYGASDS